MDDALRTSLLSAWRTTNRLALIRVERLSPGRAMLRLLEPGCDRGGAIPEAHHQGQTVLAARPHRARLPAAATNGLWQWTRRTEEAVANG